MFFYSPLSAILHFCYSSFTIEFCGHLLFYSVGYSLPDRQHTDKEVVRTFYLSLTPVLHMMRIDYLFWFLFSVLLLYVEYTNTLQYFVTFPFTSIKKCIQKIDAFLVLLHVLIIAILTRLLFGHSWWSMRYVNHLFACCKASKMIF